MGALIGSIIAEVVDLVQSLEDLSRENIAKKLRDVAAKIERGDIVPEAALERAKNRKERRDAMRDSLPEG